MKRRKHWYFISVSACVICGRATTYRERRYDRKPKDPAKRRDYIETACGSHFL